MFALLSNPKAVLRISDLKEYPCRDVLTSKLKNLELYFFDKKKTLWFSDYRKNIVFQGVAIYKRGFSNVLGGFFVSFLSDNNKGVRFETYYIDEEKLPYLYKNVIFDESDSVLWY